MGDGCVYLHKHDYIIKYEVKDLDSLRAFAKEIKSVYGLDVSVGTKRSGKTGQPIPYAKIRCKEAYEDLHKYGDFGCLKWRVPIQIHKANSQIRTAFLRSFFDDEGSVVSHEVRLYSTNLSGIRGIVKLLHRFGVNPYIRGGFGLKRNVYAIIIKNRNLLIFHKKIGFGLKRKNLKLLACLAKVCS